VSRGVNDTAITLDNDTLCSFRMTPAQRAILRKAQSLCTEMGPFSVLDFPEWNKGTVRNAFSWLARLGKIELVIRSSLAFYWVVGIPKPRTLWARMTGYETGVGASLPLLEQLTKLPTGQQSVHDLRLTFTLSSAYDSLQHSDFVAKTAPVSYDLLLKQIPISSLRQSTATVHRTDTVTVSVASTYAPFPLDLSGIADMAAALGQVRGVLSVWAPRCSIPEVNTWLITSWHFGRDSLLELSGEKFNITIEQAKETFRVYAKLMKNGKRIARHERIHSPRKTIADLIREKIDQG
jgi:hypothetical protein